MELGVGRITGRVVTLPADIDSGALLSTAPQFSISMLSPVTPSHLDSFLSFATWSAGLQTLLVYLKLIVVTCSSYVRLWPVGKFTLHLEVTCHVEVSCCFILVFRFGFVSVSLCRNNCSSPTRRTIAIRLAELWYRFCAPGVAQAEVGRMSDNRIRILTTH